MKGSVNRTKRAEELHKRASEMGLKTMTHMTELVTGQPREADSLDVAMLYYARICGVTRALCDDLMRDLDPEIRGGVDVFIDASTAQVEEDLAVRRKANG